MRFTFEKTEDVALIKSILAHPAIFRFLHDDFAPPREEWEPPFFDSMIQYFAVRGERGLIGMFMCNLHSAVEVEIHTAFLPCAWGRDVRQAACEFREWIWHETQIQRIIGKALPSNVASVRYAEAIGMKAFGIDEKSFMFDGRLQDQILFGISRPEAA